MGTDSDSSTSRLTPAYVAGHIVVPPTEPSRWGTIVGPCFTTKTFARELGLTTAEVAQAARDLKALRLVTDVDAA